MDTLSKSEDITGVIIDYLKNHPDFFREHAYLLHDLNVPHNSGRGVSSLIERQVTLLRNQIKSLEQDVNARDIKNRQDRCLATGAYSLTMELLSCKSIDGLYQALHRFLVKYEIADFLKLFIFSGQALNHATPDITFLHRQANLKMMFIELINRRKPLCGSLQEEHVKLLFGKQSGEIRSTLVIPLVRPKWDGLFVLGKSIRGRYAYGNELDTLVFITNIVSHVLNTLLSGLEDPAGTGTEKRIYYPSG